MAVTEIMEEPCPIVRADMPASIVLPLLKSSEAILVSRKENIVGIITKANSI
jgi:predicted transcriptional regulator